MSVSGVFEATVLVHNTRFKNVQFHVLDAEIPIIFGLKFLRHPEILNFTISRLNIHFEHITAEKSFSAIFFKKKSDPILTISSSATPAQSKTDEARQTLGVQIEENVNFDHSEKIANLLLSFKDVFGLDPNKCKLGNFPVTVPIKTTGEPVYISQFPIPRAYRDEVGTEIIKIIKI